MTTTTAPIPTTAVQIGDVILNNSQRPFRVEEITTETSSQFGEYVRFAGPGLDDEVALNGDNGAVAYYRPDGMVPLV